MCLILWVRIPATILLNDTYLLDEDPDSLGFYVSNMPIPYLGEETFDIDILADIDGEEGHWMASNDFTNVPKIDSIYYVYELAEPPFQDEGYYVKIMFNDPVEEQNFYHLKFEIFQNNIDKKFNFNTPRGGFFAWLQISEFGSDEEVAIKLWSAGLKVIPGSYLSVKTGDPSSADNYIRIALVGSHSDVEQGVAIINKVLN